MNSRTRSTKSPHRSAAFTLIELLVVISIIALLISILLPTMVGARRTGQRVACMGNIRQLGQGVSQYGQDNEDWIIGAPGGSGGYLRGSGVAYGPAVQRYDFMGPMAQMWGMGLAMGSGSGADVAKRFDQLRSGVGFLCPANRFVAMYYGGPTELRPAGWMVSYNTCRIQLWIRASSAAEALQPGDPPGMSWYNNGFEEKVPQDWRPSISRMGVPANKVYCADGARYSDCDTPPDFDMPCQALWGGTFSDSGPHYKGSKSWDRSRAPGNGNNGAIDARMYAFRHSTAEPPVGARANAFRLNVAYYDGHSDTLGDLEVTNPQLWLPQRTTVENAAQSMWPDAVAHFQVTGSINIGG